MTETSSTRGSETATRGQPARKLSRSITAIIMICLSSLCFTLNDTVTKFLIESYDVTIIIFVRSVLAMPLLAVMAIVLGRDRVRWSSAFWLYALRGALGGVRVEVGLGQAGRRCGDRVRDRCPGRSRGGSRVVLRGDALLDRADSDDTDESGARCGGEPGRHDLVGGAATARAERGGDVALIAHEYEGRQAVTRSHHVEVKHE